MLATEVLRKNTLMKILSSQMTIGTEKIIRICLKKLKSSIDVVTGPIIQASIYCEKENPFNIVFDYFNEAPEKIKS